MPLFFHFICFLLAVLSICFIIIAAYDIYNNSRGSECQRLKPANPQYCELGKVMRFTGANIDLSSVDVINKTLYCVFVFFMVPIKLVFFFSARRKESNIDLETLTPEDYTVMVHDIPKQTTEEELRNIFSFAGTRGDQFQIEKINFAYKIGDFVENTRQKHEYLKQIKILKKEDNPNETKFEAIKILLENTESKLQNFKKIFEEGNEHTLFTGICFVTYKTQAGAAKALDRWKLGFIGMIISKYLKFLKPYFTQETKKIRGKVIFIS